MRTAPTKTSRPRRERPAPERPRARNPYEKLPSWPGETVALLGGGPSLTPIDVAHCRDRFRVLAINRAFELAPWADLLHAHDGWFWKNFPKSLDFPGCKTSGQDAPRPVLVLPMASKKGGHPFADPQKPIHMGYDSGYQAIQLAALCKANRILLLGFDARANGNWHSGYRGRSPAQYGAAWALHRDLQVLLKIRGVECLNCTLGSSITAYPKAQLSEVI